MKLAVVIIIKRHWQYIESICNHPAKDEFDRHWVTVSISTNAVCQIHPSLDLNSHPWMITNKDPYLVVKDSVKRRSKMVWHFDCLSHDQVTSKEPLMVEVQLSIHIIPDFVVKWCASELAFVLARRFQIFYDRGILIIVPWVSRIFSLQIFRSKQEIRLKDMKISAKLMFL